MNSFSQGFRTSNDGVGFEQALEIIVERIQEQQERRKKVAEALVGIRKVSLDRV